jgi:hypothetical protein
MPKSCHLHASNFDRSSLGIVNFRVVHVNKRVLRDSLTPALITARVNAVKNYIDKALLAILLTSRWPFQGHQAAASKKGCDHHLFIACRL